MCEMGLRALALALVAGATAVAGHGIMTTPAPRDGTNVAGGNKGNNAEPCGANTATPGTPTATLAAGAETTVRYNLIAAHGGPCEVRIAATDGALAGTAALARNNACNGDDALTVTVPANLAGTAVLQWYWQGDGPYYDCADVTITGGAGGGGTAANAARTGGASSGIEDDCDPEGAWRQRFRLLSVAASPASPPPPLRLRVRLLSPRIASLVRARGELWQWRKNIRGRASGRWHTRRGTVLQKQRGGGRQRSLGSSAYPIARRGWGCCGSATDPIARWGRCRSADPRARAAQQALSNIQSVDCDYNCRRRWRLETCLGRLRIATGSSPQCKL